jgi:Fic family protein
MLINAIPLQEAKLSSEIENIVTTQDELFRAAMEEGGEFDPQTKEVVRYRSALRHGFKSVDEGRFRISLLEEICGIIRGESISFRAEETVLIGNPVTNDVVYTPPVGRSVLGERLRNLESFILNGEDLDALIKMAVAHYQFEAIHPFTDGNGRTGRILNILYLVNEDLLKIPVLYLSRFIIQNKQDYYLKLRGVTERQDWESWLLYMLEGIEETARETTKRIIAIRDLFNRTLERCRRELPANVYSMELVELIFAQPYCKIGFLVDAGIAKRETASRYLRALADIGILEGERRGRLMIYKHPALLDVLTAE